MNENKIIIDGLSEQYGGAFKMIENLINNCDKDLWEDYKRETVISQVIYHTLFFIDYYLSKNKNEIEQFKGKLGDDLMGERTDGMEWNKIFSKEDLITYLDEIRFKTNKRFQSMTLEELQRDSLFDWHGSSILSSLLYNLRHIMLHVGALHVRLNAVSKDPMKWVSKAPILK